MNQDSQPAGPQPVTLINVFEVPAGDVDEFVAAWRERAALMSNRPGFVDTRLHRALSVGSRFQLVNVAHWASVQAWQAATADPEFRHLARSATAGRAVAANPALYEVAVEITG